MATKRLTLDDLEPAALARLGVKRPRSNGFPKDAVRQHALRVLAEIADLTQDQRRRVLEHALRVNNV